MPFRGRPSPWWRRNLSGRGRLRYKLAEIEGALEADEPRLASMFAVFTTLTEDEPVASAEPLPRPGWRRPWLARTATLLAMAVVFAGSIALGALMPQQARHCVAVTTAVSWSASSPAHGPSASPTHRPSDGLTRGSGCAAYATKR